MSNQSTRPRPQPQYSATEVAALPYADFKAVVETDCKEQIHPDTAQALRAPLNTRRWYETLIGIQKSVEGQLAAIGADMRARIANSNAKVEQIEGRFTGIDSEEAATERRAQLRKTRQERMENEAQLERWRAGAIRFKTGVEERLAEARAGLHANGDDLVERVATDRDAARARVRELEEAIRVWMDSFEQQELDPTADDLELMKHVR